MLIHNLILYTRTSIFHNYIQFYECLARVQRQSINNEYKILFKVTPNWFKIKKKRHKILGNQISYSKNIAHDVKETWVCVYVCVCWSNLNILSSLRHTNRIDFIYRQHSDIWLQIIVVQKELADDER